MTTITNHFDALASRHAAIEERLQAVARLLNAACVPYALVGGNAVSLWVSHEERESTTFCRGIDFLINREDWPFVREHLGFDGFGSTEGDWQAFIWGSARRVSWDSMRFLFAGGCASPEQLLPFPRLGDPEFIQGIPCLALGRLMTMLLTGNRPIDVANVQRLIFSDLVNADWYDLLPSILKPRLKRLLADPNT